MGISTNAAYTSSASVTRPADVLAYTALDVVSNSTSTPTVLTFPEIGPTYGTIIIRTATFRVDVASVPSGMGAFRLHLYTSSPTAIADNAAFNLISADRAKYAGFIEFATPTDIGDTLWSQVDNINRQVRLSDGSLYGILQTVGAFTPTSGAVKTLNILATEAGR